jgi:hypothetical protein
MVPELIMVRDQAGHLEDQHALIAELRDGDGLDRARADVMELLVDPLVGNRSLADAEAVLASARAVIERDGEPVDRARVGFAAGWLQWSACRADLARDAFQRAWDEFEAAGHVAHRVDLGDWIAAALVFSGATQVEWADHLRRHEAAISETAGPLVMASLRAIGARASFMRGESTLDDLQQAHMEYAALCRQTGTEHRAAAHHGFLATAALMAGEMRIFEERTRARAVFIEGQADVRVLANALADWAIALSLTGRPDDALRQVERGRSVVRDEDLADHVMLDAAEGLARSLSGDLEKGRDLMDRAAERLSRLVMVPLDDVVTILAGIAARHVGDTTRMSQAAAALHVQAERRGIVRLAEFARREFGDAAAR